MEAASDYCAEVMHESEEFQALEGKVEHYEAAWKLLYDTMKELLDGTGYNLIQASAYAVVCKTMEEIGKHYNIPLGNQDAKKD
jgi:hypothetical protein